jgi:hypothetical protein
MPGENVITPPATKIWSDRAAVPEKPKIYKKKAMN